MDGDLGAPLPFRAQARSKATRPASAMLLSVLLGSEQAQREERETEGRHQPGQAVLQFHNSTRGGSWNESEAPKNYLGQ
jgi:hypothetical protein